MKTPHKHAEILRAIADGTIVQYRENDGDEWVDREDYFTANDPITHDDYSWRIKPEPKPDVYWYGVACLCDPGHEQVVHLGNINASHDNNLKLTFDGETGELKSAEVLK